MTTPVPAGAAESAGPARQAARALRQEEIAGARIGARLRVLLIPIVMAAVLYWVPDDTVWLIEACLLVVLAMGAVQIALLSDRHFRPWHLHVAVAVEMGAVGLGMFGGHIFFDPPWPPHTILDGGVVVYFFFFLALVALDFSPWLVLWAGAVAAAIWSAGVLWIASLPESVAGIPPGATLDEALALLQHPHFVDLDVWAQDILAIGITTVAMAAVVLRARRLLARQIAAARERSNLARHFSPNMVDALARQDSPLAEVRRQEVAVMFVDVVGFTRLSERLGADGTIDLLRALHRRLERIVFEHRGTFDKFLGDGIMATFGTPEPRPDDAANALRAGLEVVEEAAVWNGERSRAGREPVRLSVGLHFGEAVLGDVGSTRRLEYAVLGDTVNVAARLEELTRALGVTLAASDALVGKAGLSDTGLVDAGDRSLRGRDGAIRVWTAAPRPDGGSGR